MQDTHDNDIDFHVHQLLEKRRKIAVIWCTDDVRDVRPDLSEDHAWEVLQAVKDRHDAEWGICWATLEAVAADLYPKPAPSRKEA